MPEHSEHIKAILTEALERDAKSERQAYLAEACGGDANLRKEVESLLRSFGHAGAFLESPILDPDISLDSAQLSEGPGTTIGRYKLLEKIGEGGMAVVYMAQQEQPIRRRVALKIIKLGMDTKQVIARFEAERQALAQMDHPHIAKIFDAGATETGRPYFVMELVQGVSVTEYCDHNNLSTDERLNLFVQICKAVQHAHQKGIIHRDIKPSNVMVTQRDGTPVPKIIDFGIAKATNQRLTEKTLFTCYAHIIGTPAYMSPEQAELSEFDVDTRSDIYSLGVLLYELLTGTTPFTEEELRKAGYAEMTRIIREKEPPRPSTRLTQLRAQPHGRSKLTTSHSPLATDLDWIVMKSLEKERDRRYEAASALGLDVQRHLASEPVQARGPSFIYQLQKFLKRNRIQVVAAVATVAVIAAVGFSLSIWNAAGESRHNNILSQAQEAFARGDRKAAAECVGSILTSRHVGPDAQLLHAHIFVENGHYDEAATSLAGLVDERPAIVGAAHLLWGRIFLESKTLDAETRKEVNEHQEMAEKLLPETAETYIFRAMTAIAIKQKLDLLDEALRLDPGHYESYRLRAYIYFASRQYKKTEQDALVMIGRRPKDPLGYSLCARARYELGRHRDALTDYDNALRYISKDRARNNFLIS